MDPASAGASGLSLDGVIFALFLMALTGLCGLVWVFGSNIRKDISRLFDQNEKHGREDTDRFEKVNNRVGKLAQRMTNIDHRTEDT